MDEPRSERQKIVDRLKDIFNQRGYTQVSDVERLMGRGRGYLAEALRGPRKSTKTEGAQTESTDAEGADAEGTETGTDEGKKKSGKRLTVELILETLAALDVPTEELFVTRPKRRRRRRSEISEVSEGGQPIAVEALPAPVREASLLVKALVLELVDNELLSLDDLEARLEELTRPPESDPATPRR